MLSYFSYHPTAYCFPTGLTRWTLKVNTSMALPLEERRLTSWFTHGTFDQYMLDTLNHFWFDHLLHFRFVLDMDPFPPNLFRLLTMHSNL